MLYTELTNKTSFGASLMAEEEKIPTLFVRKASGLVRPLGLMAIIVMSMSFCIGMGINVMTINASYWYPGCQMWLAYLIGAAPFITASIVYAWLAGIMPRSGSSYVVLTRLANPVLGYVLSFGYWFMDAFVAGLVVYSSVSIWGLALFQAGIFTHNPGLVSIGTWLQTTRAMIIIGSILCITITIISNLPLKIVYYVMAFLWIVPLIGGALMIGLLLAHIPFNPTLYKSLWDGIFGAGAYDEVFKVAIANGWSTEKSSLTFSMSSTLIAVTTAAFAYGTPSAITQGVAGEIKAPLKSYVKGTLISIIVVLAYYVILSWAVYAACDPFLSAYTYVMLGGYGDQLKISPRLSPNTAVFTMPYAIQIHPILAIIIAISVAFWLSNVALPIFLMCSRFAFAWSFDRMFPEKLSWVSTRLRSPVVSNIVTGIIMTIGGYIMTFTPYLATLNIVFFWAFMDSMICLTAAIMPWTHPDFYERSPKYEVGGIPIMSIIAIIGFAFEFWLVWLAISGFKGMYGLPMWSHIMVYVVGLIIFMAYCIINRKRGIMVRDIYAQIPPE